MSCSLLISSEQCARSRSGHSPKSPCPVPNNSSKAESFPFDSFCFWKPNHPAASPLFCWEVQHLGRKRHVNPGVPKLRLGQVPPEGLARSHGVPENRVARSRRWL